MANLSFRKSRQVSSVFFFLLCFSVAPVFRPADRGRGVRRQAVRRGADHARPAGGNAARAAGRRRHRLDRAERPRALSGAWNRPAFGKRDEGSARRRHAVDHRRAGAAAGGRNPARLGRPAAADDALLPLPRRRAAGTDAAGPDADSRSPSRRETAPRQFERLLAQWWKQYAKAPSCFEPKPDYPPLVDNYLTSTLAPRLNLRLPEAKQTQVGLRRVGQGSRA